MKPKSVQKIPSKRKQEVDCEDDEQISQIKQKKITKTKKIKKVKKVVEEEVTEEVADEIADEVTEEKDVNDDPSGSEDEEDISEKFRQNMANLPLSKVRELKDKLGIKLFNKAYFGISDEKSTSESQKKESSSFTAKPKAQHRPKEISSRKKVSVFRNIYPEAQDKRKRDPRFDERGGTFKEWCFEDNYQFLNDIRKEEKDELKRQLKHAVENDDVETTGKISEAIRRLDDQERARKEKQLKKDAMKEIREENIGRMMAGERPVFKTRAEVRMKVIEKKYDQLKGENKLGKYLKKSAQKKAQKEKRQKPPIGFEQKYGYQ